jgi:hypothetical protein
LSKISPLPTLQAAVKKVLHRIRARLWPKRLLKVCHESKVFMVQGYLTVFVQDQKQWMGFKSKLANRHIWYNSPSRYKVTDRASVEKMYLNTCQSTFGWRVGVKVCTTPQDVQMKAVANTFGRPGVYCQRADYTFTCITPSSLAYSRANAAQRRPAERASRAASMACPTAVPRSSRGSPFSSTSRGATHLGCPAFHSPTHFAQPSSVVSSRATCVYLKKHAYQRHRALEES